VICLCSVASPKNDMLIGWPADHASIFRRYQGDYAVIGTTCPDEVVRVSHYQRALLEYLFPSDGQQ
jgi:hypothetical protein